MPMSVEQVTGYFDYTQLRQEIDLPADPEELPIPEFTCTEHHRSFPSEPSLKRHKERMHNL